MGRLLIDQKTPGIYASCPAKSIASLVNVIGDNWPQETA
jgi:hypothetical protein